jgi:hypothetical protein
MRPLVPTAFRIPHRSAIARVWCLVVAVAVLFGVAHAGSRYFYCESLGLSMTDPCAHEARQAACPLPSIDRAPFDCCQVITMPSMPEGARAVEPTIPSASVVAILPPVSGAVEASRASARVAWEGERWRGPPRASRERRAQLMVFLT